MTNNSASLEVARHAMDRALILETAQLRKGLSSLALITRLAPLCGALPVVLHPNWFGGCGSLTPETVAASYPYMLLPPALGLLIAAIAHALHCGLSYWVQGLDLSARRAASQLLWLLAEMDGNRPCLHFPPRTTADTRAGSRPALLALSQVVLTLIAMVMIYWAAKHFP